MAVEPRSLDRIDYRLDHKTLGDVKKVRIERGKITDVWSYYDDPFIPLGLVDVEVGGTKYTQVPLFYHCRKDWPEQSTWTDRLNEWGALCDSGWAFRCDQYVKVMMYEDQAVYILGHDDPPVYYRSSNLEPRPCLDVMRFQWKQWFNNVGWNTIHFRLSRPGIVWKGLNQPANDMSGAAIPLPQRARRLFGLRERLMFTSMWYAGDWLVVVGPVAYIIQVYSMGLPLPTTAELRVEAGVWTQARETAWLATGAEREKAADSGVYQSGILTNIPYADVVYQSELSGALNNLFVGFPMPADPSYWPRWIWTECWTYDSEREASVPGTPNTPLG